MSIIEVTAPTFTVAKVDWTRACHCPRKNRIRVCGHGTIHENRWYVQDPRGIRLSHEWFHTKKEATARAAVLADSETATQPT